MKKIVLLWLLLSVVYRVQAQIITIKDIETGKPIELASLMNESPKIFAQTNSRGEADISAFKSLEQIEIRSLGYKTITQSFLDLEAANFEVHLSTATQFDEVVVSATRWSQSSRNIPSKIAIISMKETALYNPQTAADLLGSSGEVFF